MKNIILLSLIIFLAVFSTKADPTEANEGEVIKISKAEFLKKVMDYEKSPKVWKYQGNLPAVIDFYADWCAPCRKAAPVMEELAQKYKGKVLFYKIDTDQERELASTFQIQGIPAFLWIPKTGNPTMKSGVPNDPGAIKAQFESMINEVLLKK